MTAEHTTSIAGAPTLLAIAAVIATIQLVGWLIARTGQPRVLGEIIAGIALGPSVLGLLSPRIEAWLFPPLVLSALQVLAQLGLVLFMFLVGLEFDFPALRGHGRRVLVIGHCSIVVPILCAIPLAIWLHAVLHVSTGRLGFCLFFASAMAITAFPVLARLLEETGLIRSRIGSISLACAALNDVLAWCLLAVVVAILRASGLGSAVLAVGLAVAYTVLMLAVLRPLLTKVGTVPLWAALLAAVVSAWFTEYIGLHSIFGAFLAGAVMPRTRWQAELPARLTGVVSVVLLPMFFATVGLATRIDHLSSAQLWGILAVVIATATAGKFCGAALAARACGERWPDAITLGILMNTRGLTEVIVLNVGLRLGVVSPTLFTIMVMMAVLSTLMAAPALRAIGRRRSKSASDQALDTLSAAALRA